MPTVHAVVVDPPEAGRAGRGTAQRGRIAFECAVLAGRACAIAREPVAPALDMGVAASRTLPDVVVDGLDVLFQLRAFVQMGVVCDFVQQFHPGLTLLAIARAQAQEAAKQEGTAAQYRHDQRIP